MEFANSNAYLTTAPLRKGSNMTSTKHFFIPLAIAAAFAAAACGEQGGQSPASGQAGPGPQASTRGDAPQVDEKAAEQDDAVLQARVANAIRQTSGIKTDSITVAAAGGSVHLSGVVHSGEERLRAEQIASGVHGVKAVTSSIAVEEGPPSS
jgi:hyperosmotically inducible periplasmic protein